ncbi:MAG: family 16 glycoside hydrolase, partial [Planctomycetota bacterium]
GYHNGRWAQSPQARDIDKDNLEKFKPYVQEIIRVHRMDQRVLFWEIHNEPPPGDEYRDRLKRAGYKWAKEANPTQPVLNCEKGKRGWADCEVTDIVDAHVYLHNYGPLDYLAAANPEKGTVITEAGARWKAAIRNFGDPAEMIHWLELRRKRGKSTPGVYLCWELMVGNSNCRWHWRDKPGASEPEIPWCGLMWPDATPVSLAEAEAIRRYATGKSRALFYSNFEHSTEGWKPYGAKELKAVNALNMQPEVKAVAGDERWTDYVLEGTVAIQPGKSAKTGDAGLLLRVNKPGEGLDEMRGYAVTFNINKQLVLSKIENHTPKQLEAFDLTTLDTKTRMNEWSMIRVAVNGSRIRIWFNRMHPSSDLNRGLRIDFTDEENPFLSGAIGVRAHRVEAWFDNIVVLPVDVLPQSRLGKDTGAAVPVDRAQSYDAGYTDGNGAYVGGSEIMQVGDERSVLGLGGDR